MIKIELELDQLNIIVLALKHLRDYPYFGHIDQQHRSDIVDLFDNLYTLRDNIYKTEGLRND